MMFAIELCPGGCHHRRVAVRNAAVPRLHHHASRGHGGDGAAVRLRHVELLLHQHGGPRTDERHLDGDRGGALLLLCMGAWRPRSGRTRQLFM